MKKVFLPVFLFILLGFPAIADGGDAGSGEQEEIDYLLFLPNSSNMFVNEDQAMIQLDNLARYLRARDLIPGQIHVSGYAAAAINDIEPLDLSRNRAIFVISELQRRGVSGALFSEPVGHGEVNFWGSNVDEEERSPNRRVRILLDGAYLTPAALVFAEAPVQETITDESDSKFPWIFLLPLLLIPLIAALAAKRKKKPVDQIAPAPPPKVVPVPVVLPSAVTIDSLANIEEEIRFRAYELCLERNYQNGYADEDWYKAVSEVSARYAARGYQVYVSDGSWWVRKTIEKLSP